MSKINPLKKLFEEFDIEINGSRPSDIKIHNDNFYNRVLRQDFMGLGESYMEGWWDCERLDLFFEKLIIGGQRPKNKWTSFFLMLREELINLQSKARSLIVIDQHYDLGNELFQAMLDPRMVYTCGYWQGGAQNLAQAQEAKMDLVCRKLGLEPGMRVLDIGCGFGSFMKFAAEKYGVSCVGYSLSKNQTELGQKLCKDLPIEFILKDYRDIEGKFDRVASI